ncbi:DUF4190 domain-containing protein [Cellulomonas sp. KRMCY2]|uniref:DUF4190 domain-containing protein n=1 Tax=Cellulomonas sp. KRMCY2 TaxID=1304865 RepID=UPI00045EA679|nr:DUF4190 domain-containing protein [Cellulomonas sp. KRMCY2]
MSNPPLSQPGTPAYPAQFPPAYQVLAPRTNGLAVTALVTSLLGFSLVPVICGHIALRQIRARGEAGEALAIVGLVLGYLELVATVAIIAIMIGAATLPVFLT